MVVIADATIVIVDTAAVLFVVVVSRVCHISLHNTDDENIYSICNFFASLQLLSRKFIFHGMRFFFFKPTFLGVCSIIYKHTFSWLSKKG